jgi:hypothetical protein
MRYLTYIHSSIVGLHSLSSLSLPPSKQVFLLLANFRPQKCDLDLFEGFFMEKIAQIRYISKKKRFLIAIFLMIIASSQPRIL